MVSFTWSWFPSVSLRQTHWDTLLTGAQTPSPALPPCDLRPLPTALSDFLSFKRHVNYSNEVRRDPALCHPELGTHCLSPVPRSKPGRRAPTPVRAGWVRCPLPSPRACQQRSPRPPPPPPALVPSNRQPPPAEINALLAGSSQRLKARRGARQPGMKGGPLCARGRAREGLPVLTGRPGTRRRRSRVGGTQDVHMHSCSHTGVTAAGP